VTSYSPMQLSWFASHLAVPTKSCASLHWSIGDDRLPSKIDLSGTRPPCIMTSNVGHMTYIGGHDYA